MLASTIWHRIVLAIFTLSLLTLAGVAHGAQTDPSPVGTIRGGIYQDINGDGMCLDETPGGPLPAPGIDIHFTSDGATLTLYSGSNGTYGLIPVTLGQWQVRVAPNPGVWLVTSRNPIQVEVTAGAGAVQTEVNFCVLPVGGPGLVSLPDGIRLGEPETIVAGDATQAQAEAPAETVTLDPAVQRAIISTALLTNPPEPRPPENIEDTLDTPVDAGAVPAEAWLTYLNGFREIGGLSPLTESPALTIGSQWHSRYMVVNDAPIAHSENQGNALYDPAGDQAARNGNLFATTQIEADHTWAINFWISAPFHLTPVLDPGLGEVGYGQHNEDVGNFKMAAVLDTRSNLGQAPAGTSYPIYFPGDGAATWVVRHSLYEWPDPMASCPGYSRPSGPPLVLQLGDGDLTPNASSHAVYENGRLIDSCRFDESSYNNPVAYAQSVGRTILDERDAVVIIPRRPLGVGNTYRVEVTAGGQSYSWEFTTRGAP